MTKLLKIINYLQLDNNNSNNNNNNDDDNNNNNNNITLACIETYRVLMKCSKYFKIKLNSFSPSFRIHV